MALDFKVEIPLTAVDHDMIDYLGRTDVDYEQLTISEARAETEALNVADAILDGKKGRETITLTLDVVLTEVA